MNIRKILIRIKQKYELILLVLIKNFAIHNNILRYIYLIFIFSYFHKTKINI